MLKKIIHKIAKPKHPWRQLKFDELAEIYASMSLRSFGLWIIGIFVPIYLYQNGYSLQSIFLFYTLFFLFRLPIAYASAYVIGRIGPKYSIAVSTLILIVFLTQLLTLNFFAWSMIVLAFFFSLTNGLFFVAYNTDFSKIKVTEHAGKELGWLYIFERIGAALGPLIGGILASLIAPELTIFVAIFVLVCSLIPLLLSNEPVRTHQKITYKNFPFFQHLRDYTAISGLGIDSVASLNFWPLFVGVVIFSGSVYAKLGVLFGISLAASIVCAYIIGKFVDKHSGSALLKLGVVLNSSLLFFRALSTSVFGASFITILNEPVSLAYKIPLVKGYYDATDSEEGYRIVYLAIGEVTSGAAKAFYCGVLFFACYYANSTAVLSFSFVLAAILSLLMLVQRFPALKKV
jgi:MFS family permease